MDDRCTCEDSKPSGKAEHSTGACGESQADGVPCPSPDMQCETCGKALKTPDR